MIIIKIKKFPDTQINILTIYFILHYRQLIAYQLVLNHILIRINLTQKYISLLIILLT